MSTPRLPIRPEHTSLFEEITTYVHTYMSSPTHDNSHDFAHIQRVLRNAHTLYKSELHSNAAHTSSLDTSALFLAALLHDIGDRKYVSAEVDQQSAQDPRDAHIDHDPKLHVYTLLLSRGCPSPLARKVQDIVTHVSYSHEVADPAAVQRVLAEHPELAIVQDADRLDAIGAVGIGRCFAYGGAKSLGGKGRELSGAIEHFEEKLVRLGDMMKTGTGRAMAVERTAHLRTFMAWWREEVTMGFGSEGQGLVGL